ncbi:hypothetical protein [Enorma phocaeensis]|uniref:hypothetical protein n=1 Tax=Enorma phocaeensis TaxID=1871019 RepID=UPI00320B4A93
MRNSFLNARHFDRGMKRFLIWVSLLILSIVILALLSPLRPGNTIISYTDSSVFQYIGSSMLDGAVPYRDVFDHKGPLIYFINCLGWMLHGESGIWLIEVISLTVCAILWFELAYLVNGSNSASLLSSLLGLSAFILWIEGGNLTEEYCLPFLTTILLVYVATIKTKKPVSFYFAFITGVSCAVVFLIKYNALLFVIPLISSELIKLHFDGSSFFKYACCGVIGFTLPTIAVAAWLFSNGALEECFRDYFLFNLSYAGSADLIHRLASLSGFANCSAVIATFALLVISSFSGLLKHRWAIILFRGVLASFLIGFVSTSTTGYAFGHYALFFIPFIVVSFSVVPGLLCSYEYPIQRLISSLVIILMLVEFVFPSIETAMSQTMRSADSTANQYILINQVRDRTSRGERIGIVGNSCWIYLHTETVSASSIAYLPAGIVDFTPWFNSLHDDFEESSPKLVLVADYYVDSFCNDSFLQKYSFICNAHGFNVYELRFS